MAGALTLNVLPQNHYNRVILPNDIGTGFVFFRVFCSPRSVLSSMTFHPSCTLEDILTPEMLAKPRSDISGNRVFNPQADLNVIYSALFCICEGIILHKHFYVIIKQNICNVQCTPGPMFPLCVVFFFADVKLDFCRGLYVN